MTQQGDVEAACNRSEPCSETVPLVVDLDGTLLRTDLLHRVRFTSGEKQTPWLALFMPLWLLRGRAYLKRRIFQRVRD